MTVNLEQKQKYINITAEIESGKRLSPQMAAQTAHFPGHSRASLRKSSLSCLMAVRSPKYYYLVIHDTHKLLL